MPETSSIARKKLVRDDGPVAAIAPASYVELGVATPFSFLRGASDAIELVLTALEMGMDAIGVADRNTLAGVVRMHSAAKGAGLRPLIGCRLDPIDAPEPIAVIYATPEGVPRRFVWRRAVHDIARVAGPERIAPEWWRAPSKARLRDYYRVEDSAGRRFWIYREGVVGDGRGGAPAWYLHGLFG